MDVPAKGNVLGGIVPARYILAILALLGMIIIHGLNENLSFNGASEKMMVNHTAIRIAKMGQNIGTKDLKVFSSDAECFYSWDDLPDEDRKLTLPVDGPMDMKPGNIYMYAYGWGYQTSIYVGARRAELHSAKWVMFFGVALSIVCAVLTPIIGGLGLFFLGIIRFGHGLAAGTVYPAIHVLLAKWAPLTERGFMTTVVNSGKSMGPIFSTLLAVALFPTIGWRAVFLISAVLSSIWCILWVVLVEDSPQRQRLIDIEERNMIVAALGNVIGDHPFAKKRVPWRLVFKSPAFLAIFITYITFTFGYFTLAFWVPIYMEEVLKYDVNEDIFTMTMTIVSQTVFSICLSLTLDSMHRKHYIAVVTARKISTGFATAVPAFCLVLFCFTGCQRVTAIALWAMALVTSGGIFGGIHANVIDIAPRFAGTVMAVCDIMSLLFIIILSIPLVMLANFAAAILFIIPIFLYVIGFVVYVVWASGDEQPWNNLPPKDSDVIMLTNKQEDDVEDANKATTQDTRL